MPPPPPKDISVILFDLKSSSRSSALHALSEVILYKQLSHSKDLYKLFLVNAAQTSNKLNYEGIMSLEASVNLGTLVGEIASVETGPSNWLEALDVAINELKDWFEASTVITLQVLFITDLCSFERPSSGKLLDNVINNIAKNDVFMYVIGPAINPPKTIFSEKDVVEWMSTLEVDKSDSNLKIMKKIINHTPHSVMCNYRVGVHLFHSYAYDKGGQPWQVPLSFGTLLNVPAATVSLSQPEPFKLKKEGRSNDGYKWCYEDQPDAVIDPYDTVSGLIKHGKFIKIENESRFKIEGPRSFNVLGFTKAANVSEYLLQSEGSFFVMPDQKQPEYFDLFNALVEELANEDLYILARRVYNKDFNPKFVVLMPRRNFKINGFIMCQLPYADDIAHPYVEEDPASAPRVDINKDVLKFLESIDIGNEKCKMKVPLAPHMMLSQSSLSIIDKVMEKIIGEKLEEKKFDTSNGEELNFDKFIDKWPMRKLEEIKKENFDDDGGDDFDDVDDFSFG